jgi:hypothetical protein
MSDAMHGQLLQAAHEAQDGNLLDIERVRVSRDGFDATGRYFGGLAAGERLYRIDTLYRAHYVRTTATLAQLRAALKQR